MRRLVAGPALLTLGGLLAYAACQGDVYVPPVLLRSPALLCALALVLAAIGLFALLTGIDSQRRSSAWLRLDHFVPYLRKPPKGQPPRQPAALEQWARRLLPASFFSDANTRRAGWLRKSLRWIGPTVHSAPLRRASQAICFLTFLVLFFWSCWPYGARPLTDGGVSSGWRVDDVDQQTGYWQLSGGAPANWIAGSAMRDGSLGEIHLVDERAIDPIRGMFASFRVRELNASGALLEPVERLSDEQFEQLLTSTGAWSLHQHSPWSAHYADELARREFVPAELFLIIDPLVSLSTAVAARSWVWSLASAAVILVVCVLIPRGFCGYLCPLGTLIDLFDWSVSKRIKRFRVSGEGWWVHIKYYLLAGTMVAALCGVLVSGYVAAIPVITRGMLFVGDPLQTGLFRGWGQVPPISWGHLFSIGLFFGVLSLGLLRPRFWCKYVCPSGAVFSLGNLFRMTERKVESSCIHCNKCVEICPFDAIKPDFTTRTTDCTLCQTCAGVCPTEAIKFVERWNRVELKVLNDPPTRETAIGRRGFVSLAAGTAAAVVGGVSAATITRALGASSSDPADLPVRPPGSVPEREFLQMCIRCGECFKACPFNVLQPMSFLDGLENLWTPQVVADHSGCATSCNGCGQVCPTGAIRALPLEEKRVARMGLAVLNEQTCLPLIGKGECQLCVDECTAAGYHAIEFRRVHAELDDAGLPIADSGMLAPVVLADRCVGCGLCQMSCYRVNVKQEHHLSASAIIVIAGEENEDRMMTGSYRELRRQEQRARQQSRPATDDFYVPESPTNSPDPFSPDGFGTEPATIPEPTPDGPGEILIPPTEEEDPFGIE